MDFMKRIPRVGRIAGPPLYLAILAFSLALASCGEDEPVVVIVWPEMNGAFQHRAFMPVDGSGLTCVEHGDIVVSQAGGDTFTASGDIDLDCWVGNDAIPTSSGVVQFTNCIFGSETNRQSWPISWDGRPSWTYSGEAFWANAEHMVARGTGTAVIDLRLMPPKLPGPSPGPSAGGSQFRTTRWSRGATIPDRLGKEVRKCAWYTTDALRRRFWQRCST